MSVGLSVFVSARISPDTSDLYQIFMHVAYIRGSVVLRHVYDRRIAYRWERVFFPIENALSAWKGGAWECTARAKYAIYDCRV